jgi:hypothetical protein
MGIIKNNGKETVVIEAAAKVKCYDYILNQSVVTPASIAKDTQFQKIYSNFPF